jgi:hypothetical protein
MAFDAFLAVLCLLPSYALTQRNCKGRDKDKRRTPREAPEVNDCKPRKRTTAKRPTSEEEEALGEFHFLRRTSYALGPVPGVDVMAKGLTGLRGGCCVRTTFPTTKATPAACHASTTTTPRPVARTPARAPGVPGPLEWGSWGSNAARGHKMTRIASLEQSTKHLELLVRATPKGVFELCSLIASRSFSAPPNCNPQPDDRHFFFLPVSPLS